MNIKVTLAYRGKEGTVPQGIYKLEDEQLLGIQVYLLAVGHAEWTNEDLTPPSLESKKDDHDLRRLRRKGQVVLENQGLVVESEPSKSENNPLLTELRERYEILSGKKAAKTLDEGELSTRIAALENLNPRLIGTDLAYEDSWTTASVVNADGLVIGNLSTMDESEIGALRLRYKELAGKKAYNGWDEDELRAKIAALENG